MPALSSARFVLTIEGIEILFTRCFERAMMMKYCLMMDPLTRCDDLNEVMGVMLISFTNQTRRNRLHNYKEAP